MLDFYVLDPDYYPASANPVPINEPNVASIGVGTGLLLDDLGGYTTEMQIVVVPEPTTLSLLGFTALALAMARRRK